MSYIGDTGNRHRTFLQPQVCTTVTSAPRTDTPPPVATKGILAPQHAQAEDTFHIVVRTLDTFDLHEQPQRRIQCQEIRAKGRRLGSRRSNLAPKHLGVRVQSDHRTCAPVSPVRRGGTPTVATDIPLIQTHPANCFSESSSIDQLLKVAFQVSPRFGTSTATACCRPTSVATDDADDRLAQQGLRPANFAGSDHEKSHCRGHRAQSHVCPPSPSN